MKIRLSLLLLVILSSCGTPKSDNPEWIQLFNGENLDHWIPKFNHQELGINYKETFRVEDSMLVVSYDNWDSISDEFGHLIYDQSFSHYKIRVEYKFFGEQVPGGKDWAYRNNGLLLHCQPPETIGLDVAFPISLEAQLLGGNGKDERPTGNLCTPGTHAEIDGVLHTEHCFSSTSKTYHGDQWVTFEAVVLGDSIVHHIVEGDTVFTYTRPVTGGYFFPEDAPFCEGAPVKEGYISIQAETAPTAFRKIELLDLSSQY